MQIFSIILLVYKRKNSFCIRFATTFPKPFKHYLMKKTIRLNCLMLLGFFALLNLTSCNPATDDTNKTGETLTDASGNTYNTVTVGRLTIMAENLRTTKYNDGTEIPFIPTGGQWFISTPAYCFYNNDAQKGFLYNYYAIETGKLAPTGWHTATSVEWNYLDSLGRVQFNNAYAKAMCAKSGWQASDVTNTPGNSQSTNNSWGMNAKPNGYREAGGGFAGEANQEFFWGGLWEVYPSFALTHNLDYNNTSLTQAGTTKSTGASVRCVKNY